MTNKFNQLLELNFATIDFLLQLKLFKSHKICSYCGLLSFDVFHNVYEVIKSGNE